MPEVLENEYTVSVDAKKRVTIKGAKFRHYAVQIYKDGKVVLRPRVLVDPNIIPKSTLKIIENSVSNMKKGKVSKPLNLKKY
jgi:DNA-binding transcriptional regulator/RsmH inhibitor MraZ